MISVIIVLENLKGKDQQTAPGSAEFALCLPPTFNSGPTDWGVKSQTCSIEAIAFIAICFRR